MKELTNDPHRLPAQSEIDHPKVAIVTDSIAQVPPEIAEQLGIHVVPFSVVVGEAQIYTDLTNHKLNELYKRMRQEKDLRLSTSAPSIGLYYEAFKQCFLTGADVIIYIGISSRLSHAFSTAEEAASLLREEQEQRPIFLVDTRIATVAQGFLAIEAARLANQGIEPRLIIDQIREERKRAGFAAGLETLEYLARGGRIGKAAYMFGAAIHILPVVTLNDKGEVIPVARKMGYSRVLEECVNYVKSKINKCSHLTLAVMQADVIQWAEKLRAMAVEELHPDDIFITDFTPTMVAHTGPGIIGLAYHWKP
jgi:DegV family protein with EDD domain